MVRFPVLLDEHAWEELGGLLQGILDRALELQVETIERRVESADGETLTAILGLMLFERHVPEHDRAGRAAKGGKRRSSPSPARTRKPRRPSR